MLKIFLYLIEGFIIGYFDFKFIKKDFNYYLISFFFNYFYFKSCYCWTVSRLWLFKCYYDYNSLFNEWIR